MVIRRIAILAGALLALGLVPAARAADQLVPVGDFAAPIFVASPPGDPARVFVVERAGVVRLIKDGVHQTTPFLDISSRVSVAGDGGLLSMAFPADYAATGLFYAFYTHNGSCTDFWITRLSGRAP